MTERKRMSLHIPDYLADTADLNATLSGAYLHLIMHYWVNGGLPDDDRALAKIAKLTPYQWKNFRCRLSKFFTADWRHKRIEKEIQRAEDLHERLSRAGIVGRSKQQFMARARPRHLLKERIDRSEYVPRSKKAASRESKEAEPLEPSPELSDLVKRKGPLQ